MEKFKKYALWVLGGIVVILAAILGISYERQKIQKLKRQAELAKADKQIAVAKALKDVALQKEKELSKKDDKIGERVEDIEKEIETVKKKTKELNDDQVVGEFNSLYPHSER